MAQAKKKTTIRRRRERKNIEQGQVHIQSTFNNTIVTITDMQGHAVFCFRRRENLVFCHGRNTLGKRRFMHSS